MADSLEKVKAELSSTVESQKTELNKLRKRTEELASENDDLKLVGVKLNADLVSVRAVAEAATAAVEVLRAEARQLAEAKAAPTAAADDVSALSIALDRVEAEAAASKLVAEAAMGIAATAKAKAEEADAKASTIAEARAAARRAARPRVRPRRDVTWCGALFPAACVILGKRVCRLVW